MLFVPRPLAVIVACLTFAPIAMASFAVSGEDHLETNGEPGLQRGGADPGHESENPDLPWY